jgi:hypothetical protein
MAPRSARAAFGWANVTANFTTHEFWMSRILEVGDSCPTLLNHCPLSNIEVFPEGEPR